MSQEDYNHNIATARQAIQQAMIFLEMLPEADLQEMLATVERAEGVGFVVNPTAHRNAIQDGNFDYQRLLLKTCLDLKGAIIKLNELTVKGKASKAAREAHFGPDPK